MSGGTTETVPTPGTPAGPLAGPESAPGARTTTEESRTTTEEGGIGGVGAASGGGAALPAAPGEPVRGKQGQRGPTADCTADIAGGLTFDVRLPTGAGDQDPGLLLRRRPGPSGETEEVRLPLTPVVKTADGAVTAGGPGGGEVVLRAALPSTVRLTEGRWNVFLALEGQAPRRLSPGVNDLRSLVDRTPREGRTWLGVRIPYATEHGNLTVRAWLRWPHAEAGSLRVMDGGMVLRGRLYGAGITPAARLEAWPRRGEGPPVLAAVTAEGEDFTAALPYPPLADHQLWDLWLRPAAGAEAVRVARILDDVPDKKRIFTFPACSLTPSPPGAAPTATEDDEQSETPGPRGAVTAKPYYTLNNDLAVRIDRGR
ncbi:hypothetical protein [Streptomyces axinellae]|uniref:Transferase n=1 Tax=Streptomyces axinellae TaxID=552788 RepID=A0ABP6D0P9_9ACTN